MKELSIEEKAKAYDEALKAAIAAHKDEDRHLKATLERIFPELRESEDEKIRNQIINFIEEYGNPIHCEWQKDWIAWLEKQGEHVEINPTEFDTRLQALIGKFETLPKEELVGNLSFWLNVVQNDGTYKADEKQDKQNPCETCSSPRLNCQNFPCERKKNFKPANKVEPKFKVGDWITNGDYTWKIVEVKPLDYILQSQDGNIVDDTISYVDEQFHSFTIEDAKDGDVLAYNDGSLTIFRYRLSGLDAGLYMSHVLLTDKIQFKQTCAINNVHPASKEQRDTLMKAMTDAGYTFNFEKKELKKIEQKSTWSEEDERMYKSIIYSFNHNYPLTIQQQEFVKSIKPQPKQKWSEEDEKMFSELLSSLLINASDQWVKYGKWLKTLKERITWKPTEPQLVSLTIACDRKDRVGFELTQLLKELKEL